MEQKKRKTNIDLVIKNLGSIRDRIVKEYDSTKNRESGMSPIEEASLNLQGATLWAQLIALDDAAIFMRENIK